MKRLATAIALGPVTALLVGLSPAAQSRPNFEGRWTLEGAQTVEATGRGRGGNGGRSGAQFCGLECAISQNATTLTVTRTTQAGDQKAEYTLDGTATTATMPAGQFTIVSTTTATWTDSTLAISTTSEVNGSTVTTKTELSLEPASVLKIVRTVASSGDAPVSVVQRYQRK